MPSRTGMAAGPGASPSTQGGLQSAADLQAGFQALVAQARVDRVVSVQARLGRSVDVILSREGASESWSMKADGTITNQPLAQAGRRPTMAADQVHIDADLTRLAPELQSCSGQWLDLEAAMGGGTRLRARCQQGDLDPRVVELDKTRLTTIDTRSPAGLDQMIAELSVLVPGGTVDFVDLSAETNGYQVLSSGQSVALTDGSTCRFEVTRTSDDLQDDCTEVTDELDDLSLGSTTGEQLWTTMRAIATRLNADPVDLDYTVQAGTTPGQVVVWTQLDDQVIALDTTGQSVTMG